MIDLKKDIKVSELKEAVDAVNKGDYGKADAILKEKRDETVHTVRKPDTD